LSNYKKREMPWIVPKKLDKPKFSPGLQKFLTLLMAYTDEKGRPVSALAHDNLQQVPK
jgi:hypothetical protein